MILPNGHDDLVHRTAGPQLPYTLTRGVVATREGLIFDNARLAMFVLDECEDESISYIKHEKESTKFVIPWPDAAERLRYRKGEPWCVDDGRRLYCGVSTLMFHDIPSRLHRLAAILCDDAAAFRVLHWCVYNLGGTNLGGTE